MGVDTVSGDIRNLGPIDVTGLDLLVVGSPVFYYDTPEYVKAYIQTLPDLTGIPVGAYVTFGGPEGNQHNAACSILEGLAEKQGLPVGRGTFMSISSYALSFNKNDPEARTANGTILPDRGTYEAVRAYAGLLKDRVEAGQAAAFRRTLTLREFSTWFGPEWWTKQFMDDHAIDPARCIGCGNCVAKCPTGSMDPDRHAVNRNTCVLCFGCLNNCPAGAVRMVYNDKPLMGFTTYLKKNGLAFDPHEN